MMGCIHQTIPCYGSFELNLSKENKCDLSSFLLWKVGPKRMDNRVMGNVMARGQNLLCIYLVCLCMCILFGLGR